MHFQYLLNCFFIPVNVSAIFDVTGKMYSIASNNRRQIILSSLFIFLFFLLKSESVIILDKVTISFKTMHAFLRYNSKIQTVVYINTSKINQSYCLT